MYIKRKIEDDILKYLKMPEIIALVGPRQSGKTTVMKKIYGTLNNAVFLTFEDQQVLSLFENNIKEFADAYVKNSRYVFIDEFQYAKRGGKLLKYLYDLYNVKIIISGSSAVDLTVKAIKFLVGRIFVLNLYPFDFYEFLLSRDLNYAKYYKRNKFNYKNCQKADLNPEQIKKFKEYFNEYAVWGGYPRVVLSKNVEEKEQVLRNIYNTYFLRDVKDILGLVDDYKLNKLINALALQIGNMAEYSELSGISEFSFTTLKKYFNFLSKTYICELVKPFFKNKRKEIVKNRKIYFYDTGLRNFIVKDFRPLGQRGDLGALLENSLWMQLLKNSYQAQYWRDKNKNEIDFIINLGENKIAAIEVKNNKNKYKNFPLAFTGSYPNALTFFAFLEGNEGEKDNDLFLPLL